VAEPDSLGQESILESLVWGIALFYTRRQRYDLALYYNRMLAEHVDALTECLRTLKGDIQAMSTGMAALTCVRAELMVAVGDVLDMQGKMTEGNDYLCTGCQRN
jgi:hypothetical protein